MTHRENTMLGFFSRIGGKLNNVAEFSLPDLEDNSTKIVTESSFWGSGLDLDLGSESLCSTSNRGEFILHVYSQQ